MTGARIPLFQVNPELDRNGLRQQFGICGRVQVRNVLTVPAARELRSILVQRTPWGLSWRAGDEGPHHIKRDELLIQTPTRLARIGQRVIAEARAGKYSFAYSAYPMLDAYLQGWDIGGPHDLLLEHINDEPFLNLVREITGITELVKADAQATLYSPGQFLAQHNDSHTGEGWRIAYVLNLTIDDWRPDWGGYLIFYDDEGDIVAGFQPRFNSLNLFAVPQRHSVSYVPPFSPIGRYAISGWFRDEMAESRNHSTSQQSSRIRGTVAS